MGVAAGVGVPVACSVAGIGVIVDIAAGPVTGPTPHDVSKIPAITNQTGTIKSLDFIFPPQ
jgi:hypothetical protein